jgi:tetratricopeptide (TPR) repeat protein
MTRRAKRLTLLAVVLAPVAIVAGIELATGVGRSAYALARGQQLLEQGKPAEAVTHFDEAMALRPGWAPPYHLRAFARIRLGEWDRAIADAETARTLSPQQPDIVKTLAAAHNGRGQTRSAAGDFDGAMADFEQARDLHPESPSHREALVICLAGRARQKSEAGDLDGAILDLRRSLDLQAQVQLDAADPRRVELAATLRRRGRARLEADRLDGAVTDFTESARLEPERAENRDLAAAALNRRGLASEEKENLDLALFDFTRAIEMFKTLPPPKPEVHPPGPLSEDVGPESSPRAEAYYHRGRVELGKGELDEADEDFRCAVALSARFADAYESLGQLRLRLADGEEAERLLKIAKRLRSAKAGEQSN